jgi:hypothetical protein
MPGGKDDDVRGNMVKCLKYHGAGHPWSNSRYRCIMLSELNVKLVHILKLLPSCSIDYLLSLILFYLRPSLYHL